MNGNNAWRLSGYWWHASHRDLPNNLMIDAYGTAETSPFWQSYTGGGTLPIVPSAEDGDRGVPDVAMCAGGTELAICAADIAKISSVIPSSYPQ
jgi:hypothetical protein